MRVCGRVEKGEGGREREKGRDRERRLLFPSCHVKHHYSCVSFKYTLHRFIVNMIFSLTNLIAKRKKLQKYIET